MAARLPSVFRAATSSKPAASLLRPALSQRSFQTSRPVLQDAISTPARRPVGAFRGTLFGFLLGSVIAGGGLYYYVIDEYKVSNELLIEDIYALQAAVQRLEGYVKGIEEQVKPRDK